MTVPGSRGEPSRIAALAVLAVAACSGKPRPEEATPAVAPRDGAPDVAPRGAPGHAPDAAVPEAAIADAGTLATGSGDLQVRVEWPDVPAAARSSPGRTRCRTPRAPAVAPTTTWGIPDALVVVEGAPTGAPVVARITLADCALSPGIAAGGSLAITSAVDHPARLVLRKRGTPDHLVDGDPVPVMLPIAGHTVAASLDPGAIYSLETDAAPPELAFIATLPGSATTDATGHAVVRGLAAGTHAVTAWLPPRAGQPARLGRGTATITAGELAELTVRLVP